MLSRSSYNSLMLKKSSAGTDAMNKVTQRALEAGLFMHALLPHSKFLHQICSFSFIVENIARTN